MKTLLLLFSCLCLSLQAQDYKNWVQQAPRLSDAFFTTDSATCVTERVLSAQIETGAWPKNINFFHESPSLPVDVNEGTIDNDATTTEIRFLMRRYKATADTSCLHAALRGIRYLINIQYNNGGWPQYWPRHDHYHARITFNDNAMVNVMNLLRQVYLKQSPYNSIPDAIAEEAKTSFEKGVHCILATQIRQEGKPTIWCQQYNEETLVPTGARSFELAGLASSESASIVWLLMSIPDPDNDIRQAVAGAIHWFRTHQLEDGRWARFYTLEDNRPFFCGRDGIMRFSLQEIEEERQKGYAWYGRQAQKVLDYYPQWEARSHF